VSAPAQSVVLYFDLLVAPGALSQWESPVVSFVSLGEDSSSLLLLGILCLGNFVG
jgi:hypothetical protein